MAQDNRPLSPHLQVYKLPFAGLLSITHRATGVFLTLGTLALACYFLSAAGGPESFAKAQAFWGCWFGQILLFGWTVSLYFHLGNGVRHLIWDAGKGMDIPSVNKSGVVMLVVAAILTVATWIAAYS